MNVKSAEFVTSAVKPSQYPSPVGHEIAFAGRSNVGKSSLINTLLGRKNLVKTSSTPGRTQTINFFLINNGFYFVDLPGYGYAKVSMEVRKKWGPMVVKYLKTQESLRAVVVILDIRRIPNQADHDLLDWLGHYDIPEIVVLTKADKLKKNKQAQQRTLIAKDLSKDPSALILFSATTGMGRQELWKTIGRRFEV
jgi:GTP-binding protein